MAEKKTTRSSRNAKTSTAKKTVATKATSAKAVAPAKSKRLDISKFRIPRLRRIKRPDEKAGYFLGAWHELRQVRWPNRPETWSLTLAVILFSLFFAGLILGLDYLFNELFRKVLL